MSKANSTPSVKPNKPYPDFPLFPHATGYWCKKIWGKRYYFGPWADPDGALAKYREQADALHSGKKPRSEPGATTIKDAANAFLTTKQALVNAGELSPRTWAEYKQACDLVVADFGKLRIVTDIGPDDFAPLRNAMAKRWGPHRLGKMMQYVRSLFKHAYEAGLIDRPVRFGPGFKRPSKKTFRLDRAKKGPKLFTAVEIRRLLDAASLSLRAMILLGINAGFGNSDCGSLPLAVLDLEHGWVDYPRPKTGVCRRCPLWPETVHAVKVALDSRPEPKDEKHAALVFITKYGGSWCKNTSDNPISKEIAKLLRTLGINGRKGLGFYTLRHVFRTVADESRDQPAVDFIMGHESPHMSSVYRETISDERLLAVAEHVRTWLFG